MQSRDCEFEPSRATHLWYLCRWNSHTADYGRHLVLFNRLEGLSWEVLACPLKNSMTQTVLTGCNFNSVNHCMTQQDVLWKSSNYEHIWVELRSQQPLGHACDCNWAASSEFGTYRLCSLARTSAARSYKQWVKRNLQTESKIPGPSDWLGMRS